MQSRLPFEHTAGYVPMCMCTCRTGFPLCRDRAAKQESIRVFMSLLLAAFLWLLCPCNLLTTHAHSSLFTTHGSWFTAHGSWFTAHGSWLITLHTAPGSSHRTRLLAHHTAHGSWLIAPHTAPAHRTAHGSCSSHCTWLLASCSLHSAPGFLLTALGSGSSHTALVLTATHTAPGSPLTAHYSPCSLALAHALTGSRWSTSFVLCSPLTTSLLFACCQQTIFQHLLLMTWTPHSRCHQSCCHHQYAISPSAMPLFWLAL